MLKKNRVLYNVLLSRLPLSELTELYRRSEEYSAIKFAIESEIDKRISNDEHSIEFSHHAATDRGRTARLVSTG